MVNLTGNFPFWRSMVALMTVMSFTSGAEAQIYEAKCNMWRNVMLQQTMSFRERGVPVGNAEETYNSEDDVRTRVFLKRIVRMVYAEPEKSRTYVVNGGFTQDCIKTHRGY